MQPKNEGIPFSLKGLEVFLAVCRGGGIVSAAKELGLTQPSVSQRIADLEKSLGVELFDRTRRPFSMTPAGILLQRRAEELITEASAIRPLLQNARGTKIPCLRVGLVDSLSRALSATLYRFINDKCEKGTLFAGHTSSHSDALSVRKLDVFLGSSQMSEQERLERWPILTEPFILVLPKSVKAPTTISELNQIASAIPLLKFSARSTIGMEIELQCRRLKINIPGSVEFDTAEQVANALESEKGWAITTPLCAFQGRLTSELFQFCPFPTTAFSRQLTLIARAREFGDMPETMANLSRNALAEKLFPYLAKHMNWLKSSQQEDSLIITTP